MITVKGEKGITFTHQADFPLIATCICGGEGRIAFVAYEGAKEESYVCDLHRNDKDDMWVHDAIAVAIYLCKKCLKPIAICNQG